MRQSLPIRIRQMSYGACVTEAESNPLIGQRCVACRGDEPTVTGAEMAILLPQVPDWTVVEVDGVPRLQRVFRFRTFVDALEFTDRVGSIAEEQGHHPALLTEWGRTTVSWWTHKI